MANLLLCIILLLFPLNAYAKNTTRFIPLGASITASEKSNPWRSPSGDFAFGFQQLPHDSDLFVLSIWFDKIPDKTVVWYEKGSYPVRRGSTVRLAADLGIVLRDPQGRLLYSSNAVVGHVAYGFVNDTGNFVLRDSDSTSLWQSFNNPTDTILPTQKIQINGDLISRASASNFSQGRFHARMEDDGRFVLSRESFPSESEADAVYYDMRSSDTNLLIFQESGMFSIAKRVPFSPYSILPDLKNFYMRATLDFDGIFAQYYHPKNFGGNPGWVTASSWPENICLNMKGYVGSGICGYNSVCRVENGRPVCQCPPSFSFVDPSNTYGDCKPNYEQYCNSGNHQPGTSKSDDEYEMLPLVDTDWRMKDYQKIVPSTEEQCRSNCLGDCSCGAAVFRSGQCFKKKLPLSYGKVDTLGMIALLKFKKGDHDAQSFNSSHPHVNYNLPSPATPKKNQRTLILVGSVLLGSSVVFNLILIGVGCFGFYLISNRKFRIHNLPKDFSRPTLCYFTYNELVQATAGFKEEVGRGSFGIVYKGLTRSGSESVIAVKKLDRVIQDFEKEFEAEVDVISQTRHRNLVHLIGFCNEGSHRLLVYEYMNNGTLAGFLFGAMRPNWSLRRQIALGVARGLTYLHDECVKQIIHCDIKPQNILLDEYYNARISDFGLSKTLMMNQSRTCTNIRGTKGYVAPEWFRNTQVTAKVDVYSFGVLLLEIITCRKSVCQNQQFTDEEHPILTDWVWDCFVEGRVDSLVEKDEEALSDKRAVERYVMVGIWCIQENASKRPTMREASQMLEGIVEVEVPPCPYSLL